MDPNPHECEGLNAIIFTFSPSRCPPPPLCRLEPANFLGRGDKKKLKAGVCSQRDLDEALLQRLNLLFVEPNVEKAAFCLT